MLIGIDASRANRKHKSGVEWYSFHIIKHLAKYDKENEYILYTDEPLTEDMADLNYTNNYSQIKLKPHYDKQGFQILKSPHNNFKAKILKWPFNFFWTQGRLSLEMCLKKPDVLFVPSHALPMIHPKKSIVTIHDIGFTTNNVPYDKANIGPDKGFGRFITHILARLFTIGKYSANTKDYLMWSTKFALRKAYKIITVSDFTKNEIKKVFKNKKDNIYTVYNGYDRDFYKKVTDKELIKRTFKKYGIIKPYFFYVGRIDKKKNISSLIEAFSIFKERNLKYPHKLVLAGDAGYGYDEVVYLIKEFQLDKSVVLTGWVSEDDLPVLYSESCAFIFPSNYEGFGIPLVQAMACEVPVLASNIASIPEIADNAAHLFDPNNIEKITDSFKKIVEDREYRNSLVLKGCKRTAQFSWDDSSRKILEIICK